MLYELLLRDIIEITIYSSCIFVFCTWLKADKTKNLLGYFFAYTALILVAWIAQLPTLSSFLVSYAPIALLLFIILHEKTLQRNVVALRSITPAQHASDDWLDTTISSCLSAINSNKSITIVIEHKDALDHFLDVPFLINADISKNLFDILLSSTAYDEQKMVWITTSGKIKALNSSWSVDQEAINDSLVLSADPINRMFSLAHDGMQTKNISAHRLRALIKKQLSLSSPSHHKGAYRENSTSEKHVSL